MSRHTQWNLFLTWAFGLFLSLAFVTANQNDWKTAKKKVQFLAEVHLKSPTLRCECPLRLQQACTGFFMSDRTLHFTSLHFTILQNTIRRVNSTHNAKVKVKQIVISTLHLYTKKATFVSGDWSEPPAPPTNYSPHQCLCSQVQWWSHFCNQSI